MLLISSRMDLSDLVGEGDKKYQHENNAARKGAEV